MVQEEKDRGSERLVSKQENEGLQGIERRDGYLLDENGGTYTEKGLDVLRRFVEEGLVGYLGKIVVAAVLTGLAVLSMTR